MRYKAGYKEEAKEKVLEAAGKRLKQSGINGVGIDGLMAEAGLTSGAFYTHFSSKDELFEEVITRDLGRMRDRLQKRSESGEPGWLFAYGRGYLDTRHCTDPGSGCVLPALTADAGRSCDAVRAAYEKGMAEVVEVCMEGVVGESDNERRANAWRFLSVIVGAVTVARAMPLGPGSEFILKSAEAEIRALCRG